MMICKKKPWILWAKEVWTWKSWTFETFEFCKIQRWRLGAIKIVISDASSLWYIQKERGEFPHPTDRWRLALLIQFLEKAQQILKFWNSLSSSQNVPCIQPCLRLHNMSETNNVVEEEFNFGLNLYRMLIGKNHHTFRNPLFTNWNSPLPF